MLAEFSHGTNGKAVSLANKLVKEATDHTSDPEITLDVDGALAFDLRLKNGDLMFGELRRRLASVTVLDDRSKDIVVKKYYSSATATQFLELL